MGSCISGDTLWLLGGVQLTCPSAGLLKVDLLARKWVEFGVKVYDQFVQSTNE